MPFRLGASRLNFRLFFSTSATAYGRRSKTVQDVEARLVKAVELGLIDKTAAFDEDGLFREISKILDMKIADENKTLDELFEEHAFYFGFTSLSGDQEEFEKAAEYNTAFQLIR